MNSEILKYSLLIVLGAFIGAISQAMLKKAAQKHNDNLMRDYLNPLVIFAYLLFFLTTLLSVMAYKVVPLSFGPILEATGYIYITIIGVKFFGETVNIKKIAGLFLIILGIAVYALFG